MVRGETIPLPKTTCHKYISLMVFGENLLGTNMILSTAGEEIFFFSALQVYQLLLLPIKLIRSKLTRGKKKPDSVYVGTAVHKEIKAQGGGQKVEFIYHLG